MTDDEAKKWLTEREEHQWCDCGDGGCPEHNVILRSLAETRAALIARRPVKGDRRSAMKDGGDYNTGRDHTPDCLLATMPHPVKP